MKGLEFVFLAVGSVLGAYLRFKVVESPLLFNTLPVNVLIVNVIDSQCYWGIYPWCICYNVTTMES